MNETMIREILVDMTIKTQGCDECGTGGNGLCAECKHEVMEKFSND